MHNSGWAMMARCVTDILGPDPRREAQGKRVLDVGSFNVNGTFRKLFEDLGMVYVGTDLERGDNVDVVADAYDLAPFPDNSFDFVVSGQAFEHFAFPLLAAIQMKRVCKPGGWVVIVAPCEWDEHRYPIDCYRFLPDAMSFMLNGFLKVRAFKLMPDCAGFGQKPADYFEIWDIKRRNR